MIFGIGHDICSIERMKKSSSSSSFMRRVFGCRENALFDALGPARKYQSMAANFAAKEAFLKACGKGLGDFSFGSIQILRKESGEPYFVFDGEPAKWMKEHELQAMISLTHESGIASAIVLLQNI